MFGSNFRENASGHSFFQISVIRLNLGLEASAEVPDFVTWGKKLQ